MRNYQCDTQRPWRDVAEQNRDALSGPCGGAYINFIMNEGQDRVKASYKGNYERLSKIKKK